MISPWEEEAPLGRRRGHESGGEHIQEKKERRELLPSFLPPPFLPLLQMARGEGGREDHHSNKCGGGGGGPSLRFPSPPLLPLSVFRGRERAPCQYEVSFLLLHTYSAGRGGGHVCGAGKKASSALPPPPPRHQKALAPFTAMGRTVRRRRTLPPPSPRPRQKEGGL